MLQLKNYFEKMHTMRDNLTFVPFAVFFSFTRTAKLKIKQIAFKNKNLPKTETPNRGNVLIVFTTEYNDEVLQNLKSRKRS